MFLYSDFELAMNLMKNRVGNAGVSNDIHESNLEFMRNVYNTAMFVADYLGWDKVKCDDANSEKLLSIDEIHQKVYTLTKKKI